MQNLITNVKKELNTVTNDMYQIIGCLEVLENSLYFSVERTDKDMTKPCAVAVEMIMKMLSQCQDTIIDISGELESLTD